MAAGRLARSLLLLVLPAIAKRNGRGGQSQFRVWIEEDRISERLLILIKARVDVYI